MKRHGHIFEDIVTGDNYMEAYMKYSKGKEERPEVKKFYKNLLSNLNDLRWSLIEGTHKTSPYTTMEVTYPKKRTVAKLPPKDHIQQWAILNKIEHILVGAMIRQTCSCIKGRGTHDFMKLLKKALEDVDNTFYYSQIDVHHFFPTIENVIMKEALRCKIKDPYVLNVLDEFIESYPDGLPLGVRSSQILANFMLFKFDWSAKEHFGILKNPELLNECIEKYITHVIVTDTDRYGESDLYKGPFYLKEKFMNYLKTPLKYFRFADNIIILHSDKAFLKIMKDLAIKHLKDDYLLEVNKGHDIRPVWADGIDVCGYVFFHDHIMLRKRNKYELCKDVARLRKKGVCMKKIMKIVASRIGFAMHANTRNLLRSLGLDPDYYEKRRKAKQRYKRAQKAAQRQIQIESNSEVEVNDETKINKPIVVSPPGNDTFISIENVNSHNDNIKPIKPYTPPLFT